MGRDKAFPDDLTAEIDANAVTTVRLVNLLLERAQVAGVEIEDNPRTGNPVSSGWRPPSINKNTPNAAPKSKHLLGLACDIYDPEGDLDEWLDGNEQVLVDIGLWREHPSATKGWTHCQTVPPRSGRRTFYP